MFSRRASVAPAASAAGEDDSADGAAIDLDGEHALLGCDRTQDGEKGREGKEDTFKCIQLLYRV